MPKVKICGITNIEDGIFCSHAGADALGFIFWRKTPRHISPRAAKNIIDNLDPFICKVGVFVNEDRKRVWDIASFLNLDVLQFHGKESPSYCNHFRSKFNVIKTFFPGKGYLSSLSSYKVSAYLFDIKWKEKKKGEKTLAKKFLKEIKGIKEKRIILSGGLNPSNVVYFIKRVKPYAVDVARGVEALPGKKDKELVKLFIKRAKAFDTE